MKVYQINYDLRNQRNYERLHEKIQSLGKWAHVLNSCWIIESNMTATQIRDYLAAVMDNDDGLLVTQLTGEAAWRNLDEDGTLTRWLQSTLGRAA
ncbi:DUF3884 family protein [Aliidiomarina maris]|uniref:Uncharacterized protein DUF3884 n=1 Tax=Aliidiomarina maris TaxID=531312 RepID=A0A327WW54_9GAMM|nr:DUF3884 family protein [Aliidiomarina maris]RAJ97087.1 uncharacterized protein DUF3884 [Aliidiomarina maris]RUO24687.1 hypothetical protein CWE07_08455 [Aliidiomarina maris]